MSQDDSTLTGGAIAVHCANSTVVNYDVVATLQRAAELIKKGSRAEARHLVSQVNSVVEMAENKPASKELIGQLVFFCKLAVLCELPDKATQVFADISRYNDLSDPTSLETAGDYCQIGQLFLDSGNRMNAIIAFRKAEKSLSSSAAAEALVYLARVRQVLAEL